QNRLLSSHVPDLDGRVGSAGRNQAPAVGAEGQPRDPGLRPLERVGCLHRGRVVEGDPLSHAHGEELAVGAERQTDRAPRLEEIPAPAGRRAPGRRARAPDPRGAVRAAGGGGSAVGGNGHIADVPAVPKGKAVTYRSGSEPPGSARTPQTRTV